MARTARPVLRSARSVVGRISQLLSHPTTKPDPHGERVAVDPAQVLRDPGIDLVRSVEFQSILVAPTEITRLVELSLGFEHEGADSELCLGGDWDLHTEDFDDLDFLQALRTVAEGGSWQDTAFYRDVADLLGKGMLLWECRTIDEYDTRLVYAVDGLMGEMRRYGYFPNNSRDQISVTIGRDGALLFYDGRHRLSMAKLLEIPTVPVTVVARHLRWSEFRADLAAIARPGGGGLETPLLHPDLARFPSRYGHKRYELMSRQAEPPARVVDLAAGLGYFCHRYEADGVACVAVVTDPVTRERGERLRTACGRRFTIVGDRVALPGPSDVGTDASLLLLGRAAAQLKTVAALRDLASFVDRSNAREMYLETVGPPVPRHRGRSDPSGDDVVSYLVRYSNLRRVEMLGLTEVGTVLLRLGVEQAG